MITVDQYSVALRLLCKTNPDFQEVSWDTVRTLEYRGKLMIFHPDFPVHCYHPETMGWSVITPDNMFPPKPNERNCNV